MVGAIEIGNRGLHLELGEDGGHRFIKLSDTPPEWEPSEVWIELDEVEDLVKGLLRMKAKGEAL